MTAPITNDLHLSDIIRERRQRLGLKQAEIADQLRVGPESVGLWERGLRRIELNKVPRLAFALRLDEKDVCRVALYESHPNLYATLFGSEPPSQPRSAA